MSSLCWPSLAQTRISVDEAAIVNTKLLSAANPVIGSEFPEGVSVATHEFTSAPSEENFSTRPVVKYATSRELSGSTATHVGRSSGDNAFCGASQDFIRRP